MCEQVCTTSRNTPKHRPRHPMQIIWNWPFQTDHELNSGLNEKGSYNPRLNPERSFRCVPTQWNLTIMSRPSPSWLQQRVFRQERVRSIILWPLPIVMITIMLCFTSGPSTLGLDHSEAFHVLHHHGHQHPVRWQRGVAPATARSNNHNHQYLVGHDINNAPFKQQRFTLLPIPHLRRGRINSLMCLLRELSYDPF